MCVDSSLIHGALEGRYVYPRITASGELTWMFTILYLSVSISSKVTRFSDRFLVLRSTNGKDPDCVHLFGTQNMTDSTNRTARFIKAGIRGNSKN